MKKIYIIHENDEWIEPLRLSFKHLKVPFEEWHMNRKDFDFSKSTPKGVFYNRMSASSHSRGHRYAPEKTKIVLVAFANFIISLSLIDPDGCITAETPD